MILGGTSKVDRWLQWNNLVCWYLYKHSVIKYNTAVEATANADKTVKDGHDVLNSLSHKQLYSGGELARCSERCCVREEPSTNRT